MRRILWGLGVAVLLGIVRPAPSVADSAWIYYSGSRYVGASADQRTMYVAALSDALASLTINGEFDAQWFVDCTAGKVTLAQMTRIFDQWLLNNPGIWNEAAPGLFSKAMGRACGR